MKLPLYLSLPIEGNYGWGIASRYLNRELQSRFPDVRIVNESTPNLVEGVVLQSLLDADMTPLRNVRGTYNVGYVFFENELNANSLQKLRSYDYVFVGSTWCLHRLKSRGISNCGIAIQGVDFQRFSPLPVKRNQERFVIFSGGKFELRKGQDLVLAAFRQLQRQYDEMVLINSWYNLWPETIKLFQQSKHIVLGTGGSWLEFMNNIYQLNDLDATRIQTLELVENSQLRNIFAATDIGVFPNRCEGGTNLVMMEYMACAKPVIATNTSGHRDVVHHQNALLLEDLRPFRIGDAAGSIWADWEEPSVSQLIEKIEYAYHHREQLIRLGEQAGKDMLRFTWQQTANAFLPVLAQLCAGDLRMRMNDHAISSNSAIPPSSAQIAEWIRLGRQLEQVSEFARAEQVYRTGLSRSPEWAEGWFRLAMTCLQQKKLQEAIDAFDRARSFGHKVHDSWNLQGIAYAWLGRSDEALHGFLQAIRCKPEFADAYVNASNALMDLGRPLEAEPILQSLLQREPQHVAALERLASIYHSRGEIAQAEQTYRRILAILPNHPQANLALGVLLAQRTCYEEAKPLLERASTLLPDSAEPLSNLGNCLRELGELDAAHTVLSRAIAISPNDAAVHLNLGVLSGAMGNEAAANLHYHRSLALDRRNVEALVGLGALEFYQGNYDEALTQYRKAIEVDPNHPMGHFNASQVELVQGDLVSGFLNYEWRWKTKRFKVRSFSKPAWLGESNPALTVLIYCEQGIGDTIQFCRYALLVKQLVGRVIVEAPRSLIPLMQSVAGIDQVVAAGEEGVDFDCHAAMMSLPHLLGTTLESIPASIPYVEAESARVARWKSKLCSLEAFRIGICWRGNPTHQDDRVRSMSLNQLAPLALPGVQLISLQKGAAPYELSEMQSGFSVLNLGDELDRDGGAFLDTAAIMKCLDLVISVDSAPAHLAGALGVPVWVALHRIADWRWLLDRTDSPWYPSMRLFRQKITKQWTEVIDAMRRELQASHLKRSRALCPKDATGLVP
ncbi:MAG: tetratricopeptide repeat protein [Pirellula sp.]